VTGLLTFSNLVEFERVLNSTSARGSP